MDIGASLRRARLRKRLSLEQLSKTTKIKLSLLEALENNDFERLPPIVYTRGFLRVYAREVGLDPEQTTEQYFAQLDELPPLSLAGEPVRQEPVGSRAQGTAPIEPSRRDAARQPGMAASATTPAAPASEHTSSGVQTARVLLFNNRRIAVPVGAAIVVALLIGSYFGISTRRHDTSTIANAKVQTAGAPAAAPRESDAMHAADVSPDTVRVEFKTTGPCWISANADRKPAFARLLQPGETQTVQATDELVVRVGDPSTVSVTINGVAARPLGQPRQPVTVSITKDNYRQYLAP